MSPISNKLGLLGRTKENLKDVLIEKGYDLTDETPFSDYPNVITAANSESIFKGFEYGKDWITLNSFVPSNTTNDYCVNGLYENGVFVYLWRLSNAVSVSKDGINWELVSLPGSATMVGLAFGNGVFVAVSNSKTAYYSYDAYTWTKTEIPISQTITDVAYGNGMFLVIVAATTTAQYYAARSSDGIEWEVFSTSGAYYINLAKLTWCDGYFYAISAVNVSSSSIKKSENGSAWTYENMYGSSNYYVSVASDGKRIAAAQKSTSYVQVRDESGTWSRMSLPSSNTNCCVRIKDNIIIVSGTSGLFVSVDGGSFVAVPIAPTMASQYGCATFSQSRIIVPNGSTTANYLKLCHASYNFQS